MRILHLIPRFTVGGAERLVLEYAKRLPKQDFEIRVASVRQQKIADCGLQIADFVECGGEEGFLKAMKRLRAVARDWQPDIIHTHIFSSDVAGYLLKRSFPEIKWISTQHNVARQHSSWRRLVLRRILRQADGVIAVSPRVAEELGARFGLPRARTRLIFNAIALEQWLDAPAAGLLENKTLRLAAVGRLERQKGIDRLLAALSQLRNIDWRLSVFGAGSRETELKDQAFQLGIQNLITWHGVVDNLPEQLRDIDVVVLPSRWEGMSLAVMEAMAAGRVVVASNAAGEGLITDKGNGIIVGKEKGNGKREMGKGKREMKKLGNEGINDLVAALQWVDVHRAEARTMAEKAREQAREHFDIEKHFQILAGVYRER